MTADYTVESTETEADWAYKWGQEARTRQELDLRLNSFVYDSGLFLNQVQNFLTRLENNDGSHAELLPKMVDQMLDLEDNIRNHMMRPVGCFAENERILELVKRQLDGISTNAEDKEVDGLIDDLMGTCNKQLLTQFREWIEIEGGQSQEERCEAHRSNWVAKLPRIFGEFAVTRGAPDELIKKMVEHIEKQMASRSTKN